MKNVVVLICDGKEDFQGDILSPEINITMNPTVEVYSSFDRGVDTYLGVAHVRRVDNRVIADFEFTERTKHIYMHLLDRWPAVAGRVLYKDGKNLKHIQIDSIALVTSPNSDERIHRLGTSMVSYRVRT